MSTATEVDCTGFSRCSELFEVFGDGIVHFDANGNVIAYNPAFHALIPDTDQKRLRDVLNLKARRAESDVILFACKDKVLELRLVRSACSSETMCFIRDISQQKKAEEQARILSEKMREEQKRLQLIIKNSIDEIWFADASGKFSLANPTACTHFNLPNAIDLDIEKFALSLEVFRPDGSPRPLEEAPPLRALKGETVTNQEEMIRLPHDGSLRVREVSSAPIRDEAGKIVGCVSVVRDITEKRMAEREHRLNEERLRRIVDILQHKCGDLQEFLDYALEQAIQLTGSKIGYIYHYNEERKLFVLNTWSRDVMPECNVRNPLNIYELDKTGYWGEAVRQRKPMVDNDFESANPLKKGMPAGHVRLKKFMTIPVFQDQRIIAVVGLANKELDYDEMDILQTSLLMDSIWKVVDRIKAENERRAVNEHLDQLVQQRTKELSNAMQEIEAFSYTVSHDLRGPIRRMSSFCELIAQDPANRFSDQGLTYFERARATIVLMNDLTEDILKLTKITRVELKPEDIDLSDIALNCANDLKLENPERKCSFEIEPDMRVRADRELMILALSNLLENAWKYSASQENTRIEVGRIKEGGKAGAFFVKDNGIGFDPKFKDIIFQAFQRLNSEKEYPGSGIGLATVGKIISRHGGKTWAESVEGEGATFYFTLHDS